MRALVAAVAVFLTADALPAEHQFLSPNGEFEAYTTPANEDGTGMKLYLRHTNASDLGVLLRQTDRWIDAKWSPDSRFIAVIDHLDGHISDVYVFGMATVDASPTLFYHTPDLHSYGVKWEVNGWEESRRAVILDKEVKHKTPGEITHEKIVVRIGPEPLELNPTD
jgi:hypothetical protein